ncbi:uncharacterized protein EV154DRAFT_501600 [Mucor mucedo]|uniref:uncharacterized protein n=1 Tax=Mucor mucedo TaxID=29922 RepID=UPI00221E3804|nr:uncharacterized protein EV154DRAFT_501600 [Mucor mucedo]KAI7893564.1 hypothetical protein EV154DRAFT_501600 [Mucor mucedo]
MRTLVVDTADNDIKDKCLSHFSYLFLYVTNYTLLIQIGIIYNKSYNSYPFDGLYVGITILHLSYSISIIFPLS